MPEKEKPKKKKQRIDEHFQSENNLFDNSSVPSDNNSQSEEVNSSTSTRKFTQSWLRDFKWLIQFEGKPKCTLCNKVLGNKKDTLRNKVDIKQ